MAAVAVLGAIGAYRAAVAEEDASALARTLDQGQLREVYARQQFIDDTVENSHFWTHRQALFTLATQERTRAQAMSLTDPVEAQRLNIEAQTETATAQMLHPYQSFFYHSFETALAFDPGVTKRVVFELGRLGFPVTWNEAEARRNGRLGFDMWSKLHAEVKSAFHKVSVLSLVVVVLVLALFCFTLSDLAGTRWRLLLAGAGACLAIAGVASLLFTDSASWPLVLALVPGFAGVVAGGMWLLRRLQPRTADEEAEVEPWELEPRHFSGAQVHMRKGHDRFSRGVVVGIATTAVLSAACGYAYSVAAAQTDMATSAAFRFEADMTKVASLMHSELNLALFPLATYQEMMVHVESANAMRVARNSGLSTTAPAPIMQSPRLWQDAAQAWAGVEKLDFTGIMANQFSPDMDAYFPELFVDTRLLPATQYYYGMWDAQNSMGLVWRQRSAVYLAALSLFAIALYLFGQSLSMRGEHAAYILVAFASLLVLGGVVYAGSAVVAAMRSSETGTTAVAPAPSPASASAASPAPSPSKAASPQPLVPDICTWGPPIPSPSPGDHEALAAIHFGCARLFEALAHNAEDYRPAMTEYEKAVHERPNFGAAQYSYAVVRTQASSPQGPDEYTSVSSRTPQEAAAIVSAERTALEVNRSQGLDSPEILSNLGFDTYWHGLLTGDVAEITRSIDISESAMNRYEQYTEFDGVDYYNAALAQLASGQLADARRSYAQPPDGYAAAVRADASVVTGALSDLEVLASQCSNLHGGATCGQISGALPQLKADLVKTAWPAKRSQGPSFTARAAWASPGGVRWRAAIGGWDLKRDKIVAIWYTYVPAFHAWTAISDISDAVSPNDATREPDGSYTVRTSFLTNTSFHNCLEGGAYRVEFYVNGHAAGQLRAFNAQGGYRPSLQRELNLALCLPSGWHTNEDDHVAGVYETFSAPDHRHATILLRWFNPYGGDRQRALDFTRTSVLSALGAHVAGPASCLDPPPEMVRATVRRSNDVGISQIWLANDQIAYHTIVLQHSQRPDATVCAILDSIANIETE